MMVNTVAPIYGSRLANFCRIERDGVTIAESIGVIFDLPDSVDPYEGATEHLEITVPVPTDIKSNDVIKFENGAEYEVYSTNHIPLKPTFSCTLVRLKSRFFQNVIVAKIFDTRLASSATVLIDGNEHHFRVMLIPSGEENSQFHFGTVRNTPVAQVLGDIDFVPAEGNIFRVETLGSFKVKRVCPAFEHGVYFIALEPVND
jgi:hypothetical protein